MKKKTFSPKTRTIIWIIAVIILLAAAVYIIKNPNIIGQVIHDDESYYTYNGFEFAYYDGMWNTQIQIGKQPYLIPLHYGPRDLEDLYYRGEEDPKIFLTVKANYITFDPDEEDLNYTALAVAELGLNMAQALNIKPIGACTKNITEGCSKRPIINCENDTEHAIIYLKQADETKVELKGNCLTVQGKGMDLIRAVDRLLLYWYGIMP